MYLDILSLKINENNKLKFNGNQHILNIYGKPFMNMNALRWFYKYQIFCARVNDFKVIFVIKISIIRF